MASTNPAIFGLGEVPGPYEPDVDASVAKMERQLRIACAPDTTCWGLRKTATLRHLLLSIVTSVYFDVFLATLVICNAVALGFFLPGYESGRNELIFWVGIAINCVFMIEMIVKLFAFGMWGKGAYLADKWNWLDATLVALGFFAFSIPLRPFSVFRILRLLRWMYAASPGMRVVLVACFKAIPGLLGVFILSSMTYIVFALIGVELWSGLQSGTCVAEQSHAGVVWNIPQSNGECGLPCSQQPGRCTQQFGSACRDVFGFYPNGTVTSTQAECMYAGALPENQPSFDNVGRGILLAYVMVTAQGWTDVMHRYWHAWGLSPVVTFIMIVHVLLGNWFILELTLAVVVEEYSAAVALEKERSTKLRELFLHLSADDQGDISIQIQVSSLASARRVSEISFAVVQLKRLLAHRKQELSRLSHVDGTSAALLPQTVSDAGIASHPAPLKPPQLSAPLSHNSFQSGGCALRVRRVFLSCLECILACPALPVKLRRPIRAAVRSVWFEAFAILVIISNAVLLGFERQNMTNEESTVLRNGNYVLTALFASEVALRWVEAGTEYWVSPGINKIEMVILVISILDVLSQASGLSERYSAFRSLRAVRALRVLRLTRLSGSWMSVLDRIVQAIPAALNALALLIVFLVTFALLGMQLFGGGYGDLVTGSLGDSPRLNFNSFLWALITTYEVADNSNWNDTLYQHVGIFGPGSALYMIVVIFVGNYFFLNIFLAILVDSFESAREDEEETSRKALSLAGRDDSSDNNHIGGKNTSISRQGLGALLMHRARLKLVAAMQISKEHNGASVQDRTSKKTSSSPLASLHQRRDSGLCTAEHTDPSAPAPYITVIMKTGGGGKRVKATVCWRAGRNVASVKHVHAFIPDTVETRRRHFLHLHADAKENETSNSTAALPTVLCGPDSSVALQIMMSRSGKVRITRVAAPGTPRKSPHDAEALKLTSGLSARMKGLDQRLVALSRSAAPPDVGSTILSKPPLTSTTSATISSALPAVTLQPQPLPLVQVCMSSSPRISDAQTGGDGRLDASTVGSMHAVSPPLPVGDTCIRGSTSAPKIEPPAAVCRVDLERSQNNPTAKTDGHSADSSAPNPVSVSWSTCSWLFLAARDWWLHLRLWSAMLTTHWAFETAMFLVIIYSCATLTMDSNDLHICARVNTDAKGDFCRQRLTFIYYSDFVVVGIFLFEVIACMVARGWFGSPHSYFANNWRAFDCIVVIVAAIAAFGVSPQLRALKALRAARALRLIARFPQLQLVTSALIAAMPRVRHVFVVIFLFMYVFAIIGVQAFGGAMDRCTDSLILNKAECVGSFNVTGDNCGFMPTPSAEATCRSSLLGAPLQRSWTAFYSATGYAGESFDDAARALLVVFELVTGENWPVIMMNAVDGANGVGSISPHSSPSASIYFVLSQIILNAFLVKLFAGIIIDTYNRLREEAAGSVLLSRSQQAWVANMRTIITLVPAKLIEQPHSSWRAFAILQVSIGGVANLQDIHCNPMSSLAMQRTCFRVVTCRWFDRFIAFAIFANIAVMCIRQAHEPPSFVAVEKRASITFTALFCLEAILRLIGYGLRQYFRSAWNWFDFIIVTGSIAAIATDFWSIGLLLLVFRIMRVFRLIRFSASLQQLCATFIFSLPSFINIMAMTSMAFFIYAIVGMHVFAGIRATDIYYINSDVNFDSFATAFTTLIGCSTGGSWNGILYALALQPPFCTNSLPASDGGGSNCGWHLTVPAVYFISFFMFVPVTLVSMLTAVILDAFAESKQTPTGLGDDAIAALKHNGGVYALSIDEAELFASLWSELDPACDMFLPERLVAVVIAQIPRPLGTALKGAQVVTARKRSASEASISVASAAPLPSALNDPRTGIDRNCQPATAAAAVSHLSRRLEEDDSEVPTDAALFRVRERYSGIAPHVSAAVLLHAEALIQSMPIIPDVMGRLHFNAVLNSLVDAASQTPPLGESTHCVIVEGPLSLAPPTFKLKRDITMVKAGAAYASSSTGTGSSEIIMAPLLIPPNVYTLRQQTCVRKMQHLWLQHHSREKINATAKETDTGAGIAHIPPAAI